LSAHASLWIDPAKPVLASKSVTRRLLLENAGLEVEVEAADIDERRLEREFLEGGGAPAELASLLARAKALDVSARRSPGLPAGRMSLSRQSASRARARFCLKRRKALK
jgi:predicted house-cleaning NTP pyrophosphatase (Maf/HAM1 superfamily)